MLQKFKLYFISCDISPRASAVSNALPTHAGTRYNNAG